jgi:hypothetical protein
MLSSMSLLACPFCREMFKRGERELCPVCGVKLVPFETLPLSDDALSEDGVPQQPETEVLPVVYLGRGRGLVAALSLAGLVAFFLPWIHMTMPNDVLLSGCSLAQRLGWAWGSGVAWFILAPTVLSRRTISQLRGARVAAAFLAAVPGMTALVLISRPPHGSSGVPVHFTFELGLYATLALSLAAFASAFVLGGRGDDIRVRRGTSAGQLVH